jgi:hypothetical protein
MHITLAALLSVPKVVYQSLFEIPEGDQLTNAFETVFNAVSLESLQFVICLSASN